MNPGSCRHVSIPIIGFALFCSLFASPISGASEDPKCTLPLIRAARARSDSAAARGRNAEALQILLKAEAPCGVIQFGSTENVRLLEAYGWLMSDLALRYFRLGDFTKCSETVGSALWPSKQLYSIVLSDGGSTPRLAKAFEHNQKLCTDAIERKYGFLKGSACFGKTCLSFPKKETEPVANSGIRPCQTLLMSSPGNKKAVVLVADKGPLVNPDYCCFVSTVGVGTRDGKQLVRVLGDTSTGCDGGHIQASMDGVYELSDKGQLTLVQDLSEVFD